MDISYIEQRRKLTETPNMGKRMRMGGKKKKTGWIGISYDNK
jgi:hypothetical protein